MSLVSLQVESSLGSGFAVLRCVKALSLAVVLMLWILSGILIELMVLWWLPWGPVKRGVIRSWHAVSLQILGVNVKRIGQISSQSQLVCANHLSWLDILIIGAHVPACFVAKQDVQRWPLIGTLASLAGTIYVHRGAGQQHHVFEAIRQALSQRNTVVFFPEGTTTVGDAVRPFKPFLFRSAVTQCLPVQPLCLCYQGSVSLREKIAYVGEDRFIDNLWSLLKAPRVAVQLVALKPVRAPMIRGLSVVDSQQMPADPTVKAIARDMADEAWQGISKVLSHFNREGLIEGTEIDGLAADFHHKRTHS